MERLTEFFRIMPPCLELDTRAFMQGAHWAYDVRYKADH
jgi:hypothetical protein